MTAKIASKLVRNISFPKYFEKQWLDKFDEPGNVFSIVSYRVVFYSVCLGLGLLSLVFVSVLVFVGLL